MLIPTGIYMISIFSLYSLVMAWVFSIKTTEKIEILKGAALGILLACFSSTFMFENVCDFISNYFL